MSKKKKRPIPVGRYAAVVVTVAVILYIWVFAFGGRDLGIGEASVDGSLSYSADPQVAAALQKLNSGTEEAAVIGSDRNQKEKTVCLAFYGLSDLTTNDKILRLLDEYGYHAAFFPSGIEAAENEAFVQNLTAQGNELGSAGLQGISHAERKNQTELTEELARSKTVLTALTDRPVDLLYCHDTRYTPLVLQSAFASGYSKVAAPEKSKLLDYRSFQSQQEAAAFLSALEPGTLLMIRADGRAETLPNIPPVEPDVPAIDKKPDTDALPTNPAEKPEENAVQLTQWLLQAMQDANMKTVKLDALAPSAQDVSGDGEPAAIYPFFLTDRKEAAVVLWGLPEAKTLDQVTDLLTEYRAQAAFFVTEKELETRSAEISKLAQEGFLIGNGGIDPLLCAKKLESVTEEKTMAWLPTERLPLKPAYLETELSKTAGNLGFDIIAPGNPEKPFAGALYGFELSQPGAVEHLEAALSDIQAAGLTVQNIQKMLDAPGKICAFTDAEIKNIRTVNQGQTAKAVDYVLTTESAMSFLFYGVRNRPVIRDVAQRLAEQNSTATFFVTLDEMRQQGDLISDLLREGHEIGIAYVENPRYPADFESVVRYLNSCSSYLSWRYGVTPNLVFLPSAKPEGEIAEAIHAMGFDLAGRNVNMVQSKHKELTIPEIPDVLDTDFSKVKLSRGAQVYFNANYYAADQGLAEENRPETVCGAVVDAVFSEFIAPIAYRDPRTGETVPDSCYTVKTVSELRNSPQCYTLKNNTDHLEVSENNAILSSMETAQERMDYVSEHYIGTPSATSLGDLPGFTWQERDRLDKSGRFTQEPVLFLSFDDWGTDIPINHLLYVLRKHDVKATFFIRANYVKNNPNLLRAIAVEGHEIASHSYDHLPLADYWGGAYRSLTEAETAVLRTDLVKSYQELYTYVGDVTVDGMPALSRTYRPPTLAVSKEGLSQVFDVGFTAAVSGDFSTHDYEAESAEKLLQKLQKGQITGQGLGEIKNGSVIVMHMSDEAKYTAQALDEMIPIWKEQGYRFDRIDHGLSERAPGGETVNGIS